MDQSAENRVFEPKAHYHRPKIGLALGSGVARGWAHIGVLKALAADGIFPDVVAGTSIGAVVGGAYASDNLAVLEEWVETLTPIGFFRFLDMRVRGGGLLGGKRFNELMRDKFGTLRVEELKRPFCAIGTELATGHEVWMREGNLSTAIQASFAIPGLFEPVEVNRRWLVDGALVNPLPVSVCRALGAELVIAVNLTGDIYGKARAKREGLAETGPFGVFQEFMDSPTMGGRRTANPVMAKLFGHQKDGPSIFANLVASLNIMQSRLARSRLSGDPPDVVISPRVGHVGLMEFHRGKELIEEGELAYGRTRDYLMDALAVIGYEA